VPDKGEFELNFSTKGDLAHDASQFALPLVDANYGLVLKVFGHDLPTQVKVESRAPRRPTSHSSPDLARSHSD